jgi:hypothetical protein
MCCMYFCHTRLTTQLTIAADRLYALCRCYDLDGAIEKIVDLGGADEISQASSGCGLSVDE